MLPSQRTIMAALKVEQLPSLPTILLDMLQACQGNTATFAQLATIISRDAAVAARVIALANSSFFSRGAQINSIERAILVLGTDTIKTLVITAAVQQFFSGFSSKNSASLKRFWQQSLFCSLTAKSLALLTSYSNPDEAYLCALLHNIGELVLESNYPDSYADTLGDERDGHERCRLEKIAFAVDHCEVGAWLAREWQLNEFMADAIEFHHQPVNRVLDAHHLVKIIHLSSALSEAKLSQHSYALKVGEQLFELNAALIVEIVNKIDSEIVGVAQTLGIKLDTKASSGPEEQDSEQLAQLELAKRVRNIMLMQSAAGTVNKVQSKHELGQAFQSALELVFGYRHSVVFWYDAGSNELNYIMPEQPEAVPIRFKCEAERSVVARAALERQVLGSAELSQAPSDLTVVDQQILRLVKSSGFICIPIEQRGKLFCVLVAGSHQGIESTPTERNLLTFFASEIAQNCDQTLAQLGPSHAQNQDAELGLKIDEILHEANNPLNIISNYLATLRHKLDDNSAAQEELDIIKEELQRTSQILLRLKDLDQEQQAEPGEVDINAEINSLVKLYRKSLFLSGNVHCTLALDPKLEQNKLSRNNLRQILTNLIKNAVEAMPQGGELKISTNSAVNVNGTDFAEIIVSDNGPGIPGHILKELFKPVSSTKGAEHSGLGLSISKNLIRDVQGSIACRSSSQGTSFQILLPCAD